MPTLSPNDVAKRSGMSRRSVMRAISGGSLIAKRLNTGWGIEETDYEAWMGAHAPADAQPMRVEPALPTPSPTSEVLVLQERVRGLEALVAEVRRQQIEEKAEARQREADLEKDRDAWRTMAQRPWWRRLAG